jgi:hypothetical protein
VIDISTRRLWDQPALPSVRRQPILQCYKKKVTIQQISEELSRTRRSAKWSGWYLVGGRILEGLPRGARELPGEISGELGGAVLARVDSEEVVPYSRPLLSRDDFGRDFWLGDGSGRALVRVGEGGHLHPDVELHLDSPFAQFEDEEEDLRRTRYVRSLRTGDQVYVWGRPALRYVEEAGYRDCAPIVELSPRNVLHIFDDPAWQQRLAWRSLPWYRKLSVLVRNR